jgi:hypothetical protein
MAQPSTKPIAGDIVHFVLEPGYDHAVGLVVGIVDKQEGLVNLVVFVDNALAHTRHNIVEFWNSVPYAEYAGGNRLAFSWHPVEKE